MLFVSFSDEVPDAHFSLWWAESTQDRFIHEAATLKLLHVKVFRSSSFASNVQNAACRRLHTSLVTPWRLLIRFKHCPSAVEIGNQGFLTFMTKGLSQIPSNKNGKLTVLTELMVNDIALKTPWNEHLQECFYAHVQSVLMENVVSPAITSSLCTRLAKKSCVVMT